MEHGQVLEYSLRRMHIYIYIYMVKEDGIEDCISHFYLRHIFWLLKYVCGINLVFKFFLILNRFLKINI